MKPTTNIIKSRADGKYVLTNRALLREEPATAEPKIEEPSDVLVDVDDAAATRPKTSQEIDDFIESIRIETNFLEKARTVLEKKIFESAHATLSKMKERKKYDSVLLNMFDRGSADIRPIGSYTRPILADAMIIEAEFDKEFIGSWNDDPDIGPLPQKDLAEFKSHRTTKTGFRSSAVIHVEALMKLALHFVLCGNRVRIYVPKHYDTPSKKAPCRFDNYEIAKELEKLDIIKFMERRDDFNDFLLKMAEACGGTQISLPLYEGPLGFHERLEIREYKRHKRHESAWTRVLYPYFISEHKHLLIPHEAFLGKGMSVLSARDNLMYKYQDDWKVEDNPIEHSWQDTIYENQMSFSKQVEIVRYIYTKLKLSRFEVSAVQLLFAIDLFNTKEYVEFIAKGFTPVESQIIQTVEEEDMLIRCKQKPRFMRAQDILTVEYDHPDFSLQPSLAPMKTLSPEKIGERASPTETDFGGVELVGSLLEPVSISKETMSDARTSEKEEANGASSDLDDLFASLLVTPPPTSVSEVKSSLDDLLSLQI